ncbi:MAG: UvrD-helicase domain-containing protein [Inhella sp.]|jgi:ATP-dependent helicase/nuclease subunit A|uniref:UvrD-helicase domain-containing protein n=1 Tax=Inhella sp. TaxID=1921806 RepID=UPI0022C39B67|nr:UvrD-helicase domain-containing protein [Inhella sp.]MCZ8234365.1 UvrD-helicase domain-containing protein [Inhella sp.]
MSAELAYRIDGRTVPVEDFYALACDPARSVVVEACAGAGKTWMLVSRLLRALVDGVPPEHIVAITFTRKAAAEMRQRLSSLLDQLADAALPEREQALRERGVPLTRLAEQAAELPALAQRLRAASDGVAIHTFHAWFAQLLRSAPASTLDALGLSPEMQLLDDDSLLQRPLWRRFHGALTADETLQRDYLRLAHRLGRAALDGWLAAAWQRRAEIQRAGPAWLDAVPAPEPLRDGQDAAELVDALHGELIDLARELGRQQGSKAQRAGSNLEQALGRPSAVERFQAAWSALFTKTGTPLHLGACDVHRPMCERLVNIQQARDQQDARRDHQAMCRLSTALLSAWRQLKRERGLVDMADLEQGACALLAQTDAAAWLQQRLDLRVRVLLIDEFQDTSPVQWQALSGWLSSYVGASAASPAVFLVGDPKQSIYRFRRAEPKVFAQAQHFVVQGLGGALLDCDHTRRNGPAVRHLVNACFHALEHAGQYTGFRTHTGPDDRPAWAGVWALDAPTAQVQSQVGEAGPQAHEADEADEANQADEADVWRPSLTEPRREAEVAKRQPEVDRVATLLAQLIADGAAASSIMVLARKREGLDLLAATLRRQGIPFEATEAQALLAVPAVADLVAVLDALASPSQHLSLAQALRSALFDATSDDLLALADAAQAAPPRNWVQALCNADWSAHPALARAQGLWRSWRVDGLSTPPLETLHRVLHETDFRARLSARLPACEAQGQLAAVDALLSQALALRSGQFWSLYGFVRALRERNASWQRPLVGQGVRLLTVHGAKGLEADTVVLLDADPAPSPSQRLTVLVDWPVERPQPRRVAFVASEASPPPLLAPLMTEELAQRAREERNALYVALTRARHRLIVSRTRYTRRAEGSWWQALGMDDAPAWPWSERPATVGSATPHAVWRLPAWCPPTIAGVADVQTAAQDPDAAALGQALHRVLEWLTQPTTRHEAPERGPACAAAAQMHGLDADAARRLAQAVDAVLDSDCLRPFLGTEPLLWAGNEVALWHEGRDQRLDRLVQRPAQGAEPATWWVLDYKLSLDPLSQPQYVEQMARYVEAVQALQPDAPVRGAFISADGRLHPAV